MFPRFELPIMDDGPALFDEPPDWLVPGLRPAMRETERDGLGLRSMIERTEVPPMPWSPPRRRRSNRRAARARVTRALAAPF